jgi:hypothetical protein
MTGLTHSDKQRYVSTAEGRTKRLGFGASRNGVEGVGGSKRMDPACLLCTMCSVLAAVLSSELEDSHV